MRSAFFIALFISVFFAGTTPVFAYTPTSSVTYNLADGVVYHKYTYSSLYGGYQ